jgi:hypothetical protein
VKWFTISDRQKRARKWHPKPQFHYKTKYILKNKQTVWLNREGLEHKYVETRTCDRPHPVYSRPTLRGRWRTSRPCSPRQSLKGSEIIIITYTWMRRLLVNQTKGPPLGLRRMYTDCLINTDLDVYTNCEGLCIKIYPLCFFISYRGPNRGRPKIL